MRTADREASIVIRYFRHAILPLIVAAVSVSADAGGQGASASQPASGPHEVRTAKFTIDDVDATKAFYEDLVGMTEVGRFVAEGRLVEPFMGFGDGGRIGLLAYSRKETIEKSPYPVAVVYAADLDEVARRYERARPRLAAPGSSSTTGRQRKSSSCASSG